MSKCALRCVQQPVWSPVASEHGAPQDVMKFRKAHECDLASQSRSPPCRSTLLTPDMDVPAMRSTWRLPSCGLDLVIRDNCSQSIGIPFRAF